MAHILRMGEICQMKYKPSYLLTGLYTKWFRSPDYQQNNSFSNYFYIDLVVLFRYSKEEKKRKQGEKMKKWSKDYRKIKKWERDRETSCRESKSFLGGWGRGKQDWHVKVELISQSTTTPWSLAISQDPRFGA